ARFLDYFRCDHGTIARANLGNEVPTVGGPDERSTQRHDVLRTLAVEHGETTRRQQSLEAITESEHFPTKRVGRERGPAQDRIEPGAIPAAGKNADPRFHSRRDYSIFFGSTSRPAAAH